MCAPTRRASHKAVAEAWLGVFYWHEALLCHSEQQAEDFGRAWLQPGRGEPPYTNVILSAAKNRTKACFATADPRSN
jgi:hypothetical protein